MIDQIKKVMKQVNKECFQNKLDLSRVEVKISNRFKIAAHVTSDIYVATGKMTVETLSISKNFKWTKSLLKNVVAHELIHIYEAQILNLFDPDHGMEFAKQKARINKIKGYKVTDSFVGENIQKRAAISVISEDRSRISVVANEEIAKEVIKNKKIFGKKAIMGPVTLSGAFKIQRGKNISVYQKDENGDCDFNVPYAVISRAA